MHRLGLARRFVMSVQAFKLVVAVDGGADAPEVLAQAFDQASRHDRPEIHVLRVVETPALRRAPAAGAVAAAEEALRSLVEEELDTFARGAGEWRLFLHVRPGRVAEEIESLVAEVEPELVVLGHGAEARRERLGQVTARVIARAPAPVLVARVPDYGVKEEQPAQCPRCVAVRAESRGEQWFCAEHHGEYLGTSTLLLPMGSGGLRGGPMW
jgi:nucleotide-binding universal stress UspA family protein